jgi:hypothetical protein
MRKHSRPNNPAYNSNSSHNCSCSVLRPVLANIATDMGNAVGYLLGIVSLPTRE